MLGYVKTVKNIQASVVQVKTGKSS